MMMMDFTRSWRARRTVRDPQAQGSALLLGLMTFSASTLIYLGAITTIFNGQLWVASVQRSSRAIQLAHSGVEYALWEINYGGKDFQAPDWTEPTSTNPCTNLCRYQHPLGGGQVDVTVNRMANPQGNWTITSGGTSQTTTRTVGVTVPAGSQPGLFDHALYTSGGDRSDANIYLNRNTLVDAYNSNNGTYGGSNVLNDKAIVRTDSIPTSDSLWASSATPWNAGAIVLGGDSLLGLKAQVKGILQLRKRSVSEPLGSDLDSGYVLYPAPMNAADHGITTIIDGGTPGVTDQPIGYQPRNGPAPGTTALAPAVNTVTRICPGVTKAYSEMTIGGATLVIGCTNDATDPDYSIARCDLSAYASCVTRNPAFKVRISTGNDALNVSQYALIVTTAGGLQGKILVYSPTDLYYAPVRTNGGYWGLKIASDGIYNRVKKAPGTNNYDPSKLAIYGGQAGIEDTSGFDTSTTFYGVIFSPHTTLEIAGGSNGKATFYGALNLKKIDTNTSPADFHWDEALKNAFPPAQGCNPPNCKPNQGSWTLQ